MSREERKAIKPHVCGICGREIVRGTRYVHITDNGSGRFRAMKVHIHCDALMQCAQRDEVAVGLDNAGIVQEWAAKQCEQHCRSADMCGPEGREVCPLLLNMVLPRQVLRAAQLSALEVSMNE